MLIWLAFAHTLGLFCVNFAFRDELGVGIGGTGKSLCYTTRKGGAGTGARGAPVPEEGTEVKIKRVECRIPASRSREAHVNSP